MRLANAIPQKNLSKSCQRHVTHLFKSCLFLVQLRRNYWNNIFSIRETGDWYVFNRCRASGSVLFSMISSSVDPISVMSTFSITCLNLIKTSRNIWEKLKNEVFSTSIHSKEAISKNSELNWINHESLQEDCYQLQKSVCVEFFEEILAAVIRLTWRFSCSPVTRARQS